MPTSGRLTVITGPAGAGKSVLAGRLVDVSHCDRTLWCRLASGWNQAEDIVRLARAAGGEPESDEGTNDSGGSLDLFEASGQLLELLETEPTTLVLEDFHEASGGDGERLIAEAAAFLPETSSIIVTTRARPAELVGLVDQLLLTVIDGAALAFDDDETGRWLEAVDAPSDLAASFNEMTGGWAGALAVTLRAHAVVAERGVDERLLDSLFATALSDDQLGTSAELFRLGSIVPYVTDAMVKAVGLGGAQSELKAVAGQFAFFTEEGNAWRLNAAAAAFLRETIDDDTANQWRRSAAVHLSATDPIAAVELLIEAAAWDEAGYQLAAHASQIGADRATRWLYRLPAEVRRRMPPVLSGGRATVNVSLAALSARQLVDGAVDDRQRVEAQLGLGSLQLAMGEVAEAAGTLEAGLRLAGSDHPARRSLADLLAHARWFAGDVAGAKAAMRDQPDSTWTLVLAAMTSVVDSDNRTASEQAQKAADLSEQQGLSPAAAVAIVAFATDASDLAAEAYSQAVDVGGRELAIAGPVHGYFLARDGDLTGALAVAEQIERTIGRHDHHARLAAALLRRHVTGRDSNLGDHDRDVRRVADLRGRGYAMVERFADVLARSEDVPISPSGLDIGFIDSFSMTIDETELALDSWKSRKALEVCAFLTRCGPAGVTRARAIEAIWPNRDPEKGRTLLRTALSEVRRVLEPRRPAGQESRFVATKADRVVVRGTDDITSAASAADAGDFVSCFQLLAGGLATDLPESDWVDELRPVVERMSIEAATRVAVDGGVEHSTTVMAFETLIEAEPWNKDHFDGLMAQHRAADDELAASDVERRWFADD